MKHQFAKAKIVLHHRIFELMVSELMSQKKGRLLKLFRD